jgi:hypothetical protein
MSEECPHHRTHRQAAMNASGVYASEPHAGGAYIGGPYAGGPYIGGPYAGGPYASGPYASMGPRPVAPPVAPVGWQGGESNNNYTNYMKNLHDSGYNPKSNYDSNGILRTQ